MKKVFVLLFTLSLILSLAGCKSPKTNTNDTAQPSAQTSDPTAVQSSESIPDETDLPESAEESPLPGYVFEYDGIRYDLREAHPGVQEVSEYGRLGKYVIVEGRTDGSNGVFAFINPETQKIETWRNGNALAYHSDDIRTVIFTYHNFAHYHNFEIEGTVLASLELHDGEYIRGMAYSEDKTQLIVTVETPDSTYTKTMRLKRAAASRESYTSDMYNYIPEGASSVPKVTTLTVGKVILTYETEEKLPLVYFGQVVDAETVRATKTEFADPGFEYTAYEVMDYSYEGENNVYTTVRFTRADGGHTDVRYYGYMYEDMWEAADHSYKWTVVSAEDADVSDSDR